MNISEYISSGIIESCVLGLADDQERAEFERMCAAHPEVLAARKDFETKLEAQSKMGELKPPAHLKNKIFSSLQNEADNVSARKTDPLPAPPLTGENVLDRHARQLPESSKAPVRKINTERILSAAAIVLLVFSTLLNFYFFRKYTETNNRFEALLASQSNLAQHNNALQTRLLEYENAVQLMNDPSMAIIKLQAVPTAPDTAGASTLYWDTNTKDVYLAIGKLPAPPQDQQYQLWAIVDGKPVDAGVLEMNDGPGIMKMKNIIKAEAFAITLEKKGGSPTPSLDKMYVMGKV